MSKESDKKLIAAEKVIIHQGYNSPDFSVSELTFLFPMGSISCLVDKFVVFIRHCEVSGEIFCTEESAYSITRG